MRTKVIGIGNPFRGDDAVGLIVAKQLKDRVDEDVKIHEMSGEGTALMEAWRDAEPVILVDAVQSDSKPGKVYRFDASTEKIPSRFFNYSTHAFSLAEAIELARALGELPIRLIVYGIEGRNFEAGNKLSSEVKRASEDVVQQILKEIEQT